MQTDELLFEKRGKTAWITFNRPESHNAATFGMYEQLEKSCDVIDRDHSIRIVIFRGAGGKAFMAGTDISQFRDFTSTDDAVAYEANIDRVVNRLEHLRPVSIAVLNGVCAGGGVPLALACDFRYSDTNLKFGIPIAKTLGNCLSLANVTRLIDHLGISETREMLMLGRFLSAKQALARGVINDYFPAEELNGEVDRVIERLLGSAPLTLDAVKTAVRRTLESRRLPPEFGEDYIRRCYGSEDFSGAVEAFVEKNRYEWKGK